MVLEAPDSLARAVQLIPIYFGFTSLILVFFMVYKGSPGLSWHDLPAGIGLSTQYNARSRFFAAIRMRSLVELTSA